MARKLIAGNWKMNGSLAFASELVGGLLSRLEQNSTAADFAVCPPAALLGQVTGLTKGTALAVGGQDCHANTSGAHTGDTSAELLKDLGCQYVLTGHSERRTDHGESSADVKAKSSAAIKAGLIPIICIGETEGQRVSGDTLKVVEQQVRESLPDEATSVNVVLAYEPVWAIGTGKTATPDDVAEVHNFIRGLLDRHFDEATDGKLKILYGGSVKPSNAAELLGVSNVDGALVGGASLKVEDFWAIGVR
ncbi:triose-phosphate isomerase [Kiloniella laminariae]|uniref:Triosephosphate isomerase n=1 Tax=Kiloniella laminariae TaxID=454162 RepID=A0ABT4LLS2_9PROT|nr:triose-phosphate isomerase [Kiloniella laminariae]MCZ4282052.1 triose-phosphate isomerase [Kiloniella laminariae]